jgi:hypothetical protein
MRAANAGLNKKRPIGPNVVFLVQSGAMDITHSSALLQ